VQKIGFFIPYFGPLPCWFELFLESCRHNSNIQFYLFNDTSLSFECPPNVQAEKMTLAQFNHLASRRLKLPTKVKSPFKVCDFRPAFGEIFGVGEMDLDFWGYCDLDIILGNLRRFLNEDLLEQFDVISAASRFMAGPFSILRNTQPVRSLYRRSKSLNLVMTESCHFSFDELGPNVKWDWKGGFVVNRSTNFESFTDIILAASQNRELRTFFGLNYYNDPDIPSRAKGAVLWMDGELKVQSTGEDLLFYHFQKGKNSFASWFFPNGDEGRPGFLIKANGFFPCEHEYIV
jgi:hypothetical protein